MFSLRDFAEPGDLYTDFTTGERGIVPFPEDEEDQDWRFWIHDSVIEDQADQPDVGMPFGAATVGIVDENEGGVILYCHKDSAPIILDMLRRAAVDDAE